MAQKPPELFGSIVAFEGRPDCISTQLRLLPTSSQILILPNIQSYLTSENGVEQPFDSCTHVWHVHDALQRRNEAARAFLQASSASSKRLVFLNGGTPNAQAICIQAIMDNETDGIKEAAEAIFADLVKDGVTGLKERLQARLRRNTFGLVSDIPEEEPWVGEDDRVSDSLEDPITRAMRAADALDRQTENLQLPLDLASSNSTRPRSSSLPLYGYLDEFGDAAHFFVFGARRDDKEVGLDDVENDAAVLATQSGEGSRTLDLLGCEVSSSAPYSPSCVGETYQSNAKTDREADASPLSDLFTIRNPEHVVPGAASLLDWRRSVSYSPLPRVRSLDRIYPTGPKLRDVCFPLGPSPVELDTSKVARPRSLVAHAAAALRPQSMGYHDASRLSALRASTTGRPQSLMVPNARGSQSTATMRLRPQSLAAFSNEKEAASESRLKSLNRPRSMFVKSKIPIVKIDAVPRFRAEKRQSSARPSYVDRGTDADDSLDSSTPFTPLFACTEDLIVYLKDETTMDDLLDSVVGAFKDYRYPLLSHSPTASEPEKDEKLEPGTPKSRPLERCMETGEPSQEDGGAAPPSSSMEDYDPFAYTQPEWKFAKPAHDAPTVTIVRPPTPAQTPPPASGPAENGHKIHDFILAPNQTAVAVQNSLRSILGEYFPQESQGYHQFQFSLLPELDELWKPVFRRSGSQGSQKDGGKTQQILAIGSQESVKKEYTLAITTQLEKLGSKSSDNGRADRLDFRYLLANAMQTFTAMPLANQTSDNPFNNSYLLATLIVPHLETFLALHSEVRYLLLQYPPEHFRTMLSLQKLVGVDLMKVAQIVDATSKDQLPLNHMRGSSVSSKSETVPGKWSGPSTKPSSDISTGKANFLLTSTATDRDIATFVSSVWNIPAEVLEPEIPEVPVPAAAAKKTKAPRKGSTKESLSRLPRMGTQCPPSPTMGTSPSSPVARPTSAAGTIKTLTSIRSRRHRSKSRSRAAQQQQADAMSILTLDVNDDSEYDVEERRLMPMYMQRSSLRKPNSRKALKFLGLA